MPALLFTSAPCWQTFASLRNAEVLHARNTWFVPFLKAAFLPNDPVSQTSYLFDSGLLDLEVSVFRKVFDTYEL